REARLAGRVNCSAGQAAKSRRLLDQRERSLDGRRSEPGHGLCSDGPGLLQAGQIMPSIRVVGLTAYVVDLRLRRPVRHASHTRTSTDNIIVRCTLSDGGVGWGEGVPREYVTGESADSAIDLMRQSDLKKQFTPCEDFSAAVRLAEKL